LALISRLVDADVNPALLKNFCQKNFSVGWTVCRFHGARGGAPEGKRNGNYRHGARTRATIELWRFIKSLR
jgi:hypothetical protein